MALASALVAAGCASPHSIDARPAAAQARTTATPAADPGVPWINVRQVGTAYAGQPARYEVETANMMYGSFNRIDWGDGHGSEGSSAHIPCARPDAGRGPSTEEGDHIYRFPGQWTVTVTVGPVCGDSTVPGYVGTGVITVLPADVPSNGPHRPLSGDLPLACDEASNPYPGPRPPALAIECVPDYLDEDGYVTSVVIDWGDGSTASTWNYPLSDCVESTTTWPSTPFDEDATDDPWGAQHVYPAKGIYRAHVTVTSSGCDGKDVQVSTASTRVTVE
ncbi:MAG TPA: hypothetical protein VNQ77_06670 [Frankiaceae bacterium]|nr:hypothetical protein [Frankiaceae bacterium]